jgi:UPF0042 nucleotide-binding protein
VLLVTGPSGSGRSTAIAALEDLGFEAIDNPPLSVLPSLIGGRPLALGVDARGREFSAAGLLDAAADLSARGLRVETLFLDCRADVLLRRYSETRRRHPLAPWEDPATGIAREAALLEGLRERATRLLDTSEMTPHHLRAELGRIYGVAGPAPGGVAVTLTSFSHRRGIPAGVDWALDVRFLRNPHWEPALRPRDGTDPEVAAHVAADPRHDAFLEAALGLLRVAIPGHEAEGRAHLTVGVGCTGGQHRSVAVVGSLARALAAEGIRVSTSHRELERRAAASPAASPEESGVPRGAGARLGGRGAA